jgi:hypothetical protein
MTMLKHRLLTFAASVLAAFSMSVPAAHANADVYVLHGIPGADLGLPAEAPVDVLVNDSICLLEEFEFGNLVGPVSLPAGDYNIKVFVADGVEGCPAGLAAFEADFTLADGDQVVIAAHLFDNGGAPAPALNAFSLDLSRVMPGMTRLAGHHAAAAPEVTVQVRNGQRPGAVSLPGVTTGDQFATTVRPGAWQISVTPTGAMTPALWPATMNLRPFTAHLAFVVGSVTNGTLTLIQQALPVARR